MKCAENKTLKILECVVHLQSMETVFGLYR